MNIYALAGGPLNTNGYLVCEGDGGKCLIVDAPVGSTRRFVEMIREHGLTVEYIVNTHGHWDHTADNVPLVKATGALLCAHTWDATRLANPRLATEGEDAFPVPPSRADKSLQDGERLQVGRLSFEIMHTPGHTPGSVCIYEVNSGVLFTGDLLLRTSISRTDFPGSNSRQLAESLKRLAQLPDETRIYPGHGLSTTLHEERWLMEIAGKVIANS